MAAAGTLARLLTDVITLYVQTEDAANPGDWTEDAGTELAAYVERRSTADTNADGAVIITTEHLVILDAGTTVGPHARIDWHGRRLEVTGEPWPAFNPRAGTIDHLELRCREVS